MVVTIQITLPSNNYPASCCDQPLIPPETGHIISINDILHYPIEVDKCHILVNALLKQSNINMASLQKQKQQLHIL